MYDLRIVDDNGRSSFLSSETYPNQVYNRFVCQRPAFVNGTKPVAPSTCEPNALFYPGDEVFSPGYPYALATNGQLAIGS